MGDTYWMPVCQFCGNKNEIGVRRTSGNFPPIDLPKLSTFTSPICHESPTREHNIQWMRIK